MSHPTDPDAPTPTPAPRKLDPGDVRFFSGQSNMPLAQSIADHCGVPLETTDFKRFSNDNLYVQLGASVRGRAVYIVQSLTPPVSNHLMQLLLMLDIAHGAGAREVHAIIPYFSYARSDKKDAPRISIAARLIADLLQTAGATHVMTMTLHAPQVHGFFGVPTDPITARGEFVTELAKSQFGADTVVVAPDFGRAGSATRLAEQLGLAVAVADKVRKDDNTVEIGKLIEPQMYEKNYRRAIIYDDEVATGGTTITLCEKLIQLKIEEIIAACTHGLFTGDAVPRLLALPQVKRIITTDTVLIPEEKSKERMTILKVGKVFSQALLANYYRESIGEAFIYVKPDKKVSPEPAK